MSRFELFWGFNFNHIYYVEQNVRGHLHKLKFVQVIANVSLNLLDQEHATFHALRLSHRNDRQKKWASGSLLAKTDETCIFRLVPRRFL
jgi:hypothetical protein